MDWAGSLQFLLEGIVLASLLWAQTLDIILVPWKDVRSRETLFGLVSSEVFLAWYLDLGPVFWAEADDPARPYAFKD